MKKIISNNKLLQTLVDLFTQPSKVIEDKEDNYISGYGYTTSMTGLIFFIILFLDKLLFTDGLRDNNWRVPSRIQIHDSIADNVYEDFYGFILTVGFFPGIYLALLLVQNNKKSIVQLFQLALYLVTQMLVLFSPFIVLNYVFDIDVDSLILILVPSYFIYFFIKLHLDHWLVASLKGIIVLVAGFISLSLVEKPLFNFFNILMERPDLVYEIEVEDKSIFRNQFSIQSNSDDIFEVDKANSSYFFRDAHRVFGSFDDGGEIAWERMESASIDKLLLVKEPQVICIFLDTLINDRPKDLLKLYSFEGDLLLASILQEDLYGRTYRIIQESSNSFELMFPSKVGIYDRYEYQKGSFTKVENGQWKLQITPFFTTTESIVDVTETTDSDFIVSTFISDGWQFASFGIMRTDSSMSPVWKHTIYDKKDPYDPRVPLFYVINESENDVITHYSLANDTITISFLKALDVKSGAVKWEREFYIPADFTEYFRMDYDENYLYIVGESHMSIRKFFWQPTFHAAMVCKIDRRNGELIGVKHFGNTDFEGHSRISDLILTDSTLQLFGTEHHGDFFFSEDDHHFLWELSKEDI